MRLNEPSARITLDIPILELINCFFSQIEQPLCQCVLYV